MADATYDAVVIGAGNKSLITAMYLAAYGGMDVAVFEARHELGGGISSEEGPAPGFIANTHSTYHYECYFNLIYEDFSGFRDRGAVSVNPLVSLGGILQEDQSCILLYHEEYDPNQEKTANEIARFSEKDAETWLMWWGKWKKLYEPAFMEWLYTPATPPNVPDAIERALMDPESGFEPQWLQMSPLQVYKDVYESPAFYNILFRAMHSFYVQSPNTFGLGLFQHIGIFMFLRPTLFVGGTHSLAHAMYKILVESSGKTFTKCTVDKILVDNGKARGIRLSDGSEIEAKKLVLHGGSPQQLCLEFLDEEYLDPKIIKRVKNIQQDHYCITWYDWALHELPDYKAAEFNADVGQCSWLVLGDRDEKRIIGAHGLIEAGIAPPASSTMVACPHSMFDKTRAPEGKHLLKTEIATVPATALTEKQWLEFKKTNAQAELDHLHQYAPNMTWDNVIGYFPLTPYDAAHIGNMAPHGNMGSGADLIPGQIGKFRPTPELAGHKVPGIRGLYATGSAWPPFSCASSWQGYNCYKVIAEDLNLRKPWQEKGRAY